MNKIAFITLAGAILASSALLGTVEASASLIREGPTISAPSSGTDVALNDVAEVMVIRNIEGGTFALVVENSRPKYSLVAVAGAKAAKPPGGAARFSRNVVRYT